MKKISVVIPVYNEKDIIFESIHRVIQVMESIAGYDYDIILIDNASTDGSDDILRMMGKNNKNLKIIFNEVNVGWSRSSFYAMLRADGDAVVLLSADMQEPPELIPQFIKEYENGHKIVIGIKSHSKENKMMYFIRGLYYKLLKNIAEIKHIEQFMGFGLYDKSFIETLRDLKDPLPYLRGLVPELCGDILEIEYTQENRKKGKSHFNFWNKYDVAMLGITSYSKILVRFSTVMGGCLATISILLAIFTLVMKISGIITYPTGVAAILVSVFVLNSLTLFFLGIIGEYIICINQRLMNRPLVNVKEEMNI